MSKSQAIGTSCETAVVNCAKSREYVSARRIAKTGARDTGDVFLQSGLIAQVKGGKRAEAATDAQVRTWMNDALKQAVNYTELHQEHVWVVLVRKRAGVGLSSASGWWAHYVVDSDKSRMAIVHTVSLGNYLRIWKSRYRQRLIGGYVE